jgi:hypothetical protein
VTNDARIDLYIHFDPAPQVLTLLTQILTGVTKMSTELDTLTAAVQKNSDAEDSAIVLLQGLKTALDAAIASGNPQALVALSAQIGIKTDALAAAIVANTPAAPAP